MRDLNQLRVDLRYALDECDPNDFRAWNAISAAEDALTELEAENAQLREQVEALSERLQRDV